MFTVPPASSAARPLHCGSCWALPHDNGAEQRDRWRSLLEGGTTKKKKKKHAKVGGPWGGRSQPGLLPGTWENIRGGGGSEPSEKEVLDLF